MLVWSVDANVPLFGLKFTILFILCLILFLILMPFNIILLFTRTLSRSRFINKFKPLLDAYHGPYKDKYYYWTGLQLLIRVVFFGLSSLDRNINLIVSTILLAIFSGICGVIQPYKSKAKNYQELVLILNLHGLYVISLHNYIPTLINILIIMAAVQLTFIIMYHISTYGTYMLGGQIKSRIQLSIKTMKERINRFCNKPQHTLLHAYHEYREPLVGQNF